MPGQVLMLLLARIGWQVSVAKNTKFEVTDFLN
jgi:hypothetical protein